MLRSAPASKPEVSVIVPVRTETVGPYLERLRLRDRCELSAIATIVVDAGSAEPASAALQEFCAERGWQYVYEDSRGQPFSLARARNIGIARASTEWVLLDDVDMVYDGQFFQHLLKELPLLAETPFSFLSVPAVYLTCTATEAVLSVGEVDPLRPRLLTQLALEDPRGSTENEWIEHFAPASAILVLRKNTALAVGGYDTLFEGWGGEDRDFVFRLLCANKQLPRPRQFSATKVWNLNDTRCFEGWRALFRLHGDYLARKGIYAFHLYHEPRAWREQKTASSNMKRAAHQAVQLQKEESHWVAEYHPLYRSLLFSAYLTPTGATSAGGRQRKLRPLQKRLFAKSAKLWRDPHAFFSDTRHPVLRMFRRLFRKRENLA